MSSKPNARGGDAAPTSWDGARSGSLSARQTNPQIGIFYVSYLTQGVGHPAFSRIWAGGPTTYRRINISSPSLRTAYGAAGQGARARPHPGPGVTSRRNEFKRP